MLKRLWMIFGPVLIAGLLVALVICCYPESVRHDIVSEKHSAASVTAESFRERNQNQKLYLILLSDLYLSLAPVNGFVLTVLILRYWLRNTIVPTILIF